VDDAALSSIAKRAEEILRALKIYRSMFPSAILLPRNGIW
jgi:hypothetical protein